MINKKKLSSIYELAEMRGRHSFCETVEKKNCTNFEIFEKCEIKSVILYFE
jgi:hypothetical protein